MNLSQAHLPRTNARSVAVITACLLLWGCAANPPRNAEPKPPETTLSPAPASGPGTQKPSAPGLGQPGPQPPARAIAPPPPVPKNLPVNGSIKDPLLRKLFANSNVSGDDLYESLKAMRLEMRAKRTAKSWATASAAVDRLANDVTRQGALHVATKAALDFAKNAVKTEALSVSYQALDEHLAMLLGADRRVALSNERLTLPSAADMDERQARRTLNMALMVVVARLSDKVLEQAKADFKTLSTDYKALIEEREQARMVRCEDREFGDGCECVGLDVGREGLALALS